MDEDSAIIEGEKLGACWSHGCVGGHLLNMVSAQA